LKLLDNQGEEIDFLEKKIEKIIKSKDFHDISLCTHFHYFFQYLYDCEKLDFLVKNIENEKYKN